MDFLDQSIRYACAPLLAYIPRRWRDRIPLAMLMIIMLWWFIPAYAVFALLVLYYYFVNNKVKKIDNDNPPPNQLPQRNIHAYRTNSLLGHGRFSEVYAGVNLLSHKRVVIKILKPISKFQIEKEINILKVICTVPNTVRIIEAIQNEKSGTVCLIFEDQIGAVYDLKDEANLKKLDARTIKSIMNQLLTTMSSVHGMGIVHKDLNFSNVLFNQKTMRILVVDWGHSDYYANKQVENESEAMGYVKNTRIGTLGYKSPELLLNDLSYDYKIDVWAIGCMFADLLYAKHSFFKGKGIENNIKSIMKYLGSGPVQLLIKTHNYASNPCINGKLVEYINGNDYLKLASHAGIRTIVGINKEVAFDLLLQLLEVDNRSRIDTIKALKHHFFA